MYGLNVAIKRELPIYYFIHLILENNTSRCYLVLKIVFHQKTFFVKFVQLLFPFRGIV